MAWQTSVGMGGSGGSAGAGSDAGGSGTGQPQGTEYTLQGKRSCAVDVVHGLWGGAPTVPLSDVLDHRCYALPTDRMAQT